MKPENMWLQVKFSVTLSVTAWHTGITTENMEGCVYIYIHTPVIKLEITMTEIFKRLISQASFKFQNKAWLGCCSLTAHSHRGCFVITTNHYQDIVTTFNPYQSYPQLTVPTECSWTDTVQLPGWQLWALTAHLAVRPGWPHLRAPQ